MSWRAPDRRRNRVKSGLEKLGFPWILSSESRLINGLQAIFGRNILLPVGGGHRACWAVRFAVCAQSPKSEPEILSCVRARSLASPEAVNHGAVALFWQGDVGSSDSRISFDGGWRRGTSLWRGQSNRLGVARAAWGWVPPRLARQRDGHDAPDRCRPAVEIQGDERGRSQRITSNAGVPTSSKRSRPNNPKSHKCEKFACSSVLSMLGIEGSLFNNLSSKRANRD
jgi:hypothetical protein